MKVIEPGLSPSELAEKARSERPGPVARVAELGRRIARSIPGLHRLFQSEQGRALRHWIALRVDDRVHYTFTQFVRSPAQFEALVGPVLDFLLGERREGKLRIAVIGCSIGAEPYTISSILLRRCPALEVEIEGYDIDQEVVARARQARFTERDVLGSTHVTPEFVEQTFERDGDDFVVRPEVARRVRVSLMDALDPAMPEKVKPAEIVYAQNILMNLPRGQARQAFRNISRLLASRAALFIDGVDLDMRESETRRAGLTPLDYRIRDIHEEAMQIRGDRYPYHYSGLPPFNQRGDSARRFATIFLRHALQITWLLGELLSGDRGMLA